MVQSNLFPVTNSNVDYYTGFFIGKQLNNNNQRNKGLRCAIPNVIIKNLPRENETQVMEICVSFCLGKSVNLFSSA